MPLVFHVFSGPGPPFAFGMGRNAKGGEVSSCRDVRDGTSVFFYHCVGARLPNTLAKPQGGDAFPPDVVMERTKGGKKVPLFRFGCRGGKCEKLKRNWKGGWVAL